MHNFVYLAQRRSQEFSCEPNFGGGRAAPPWLRHWYGHRKCPQRSEAYRFAVDARRYLGCRILRRAQHRSKQQLADSCPDARTYVSVTQLQLGVIVGPGACLLGDGRRYCLSVEGCVTTAVSCVLAGTPQSPVASIPGGEARGAIAPPPIKIYLGESIFSPPQSFSLCI